MVKEKCFILTNFCLYKIVSLLVIVFTLVCRYVLYKYVPSWMYDISANWCRCRLWHCEGLFENSRNSHVWPQNHLLLQWGKKPSTRVFWSFVKWTEPSFIVSQVSSVPQCLRTGQLLHPHVTFACDFPIPQLLEWLQRPLPGAIQTT